MSIVKNHKLFYIHIALFHKRAYNFHNMNELFELLNKKGLNNHDQIEHSIMHRLSATQIIDLQKELYDVVEKNSPSSELLDISSFSFHSDSDMSSQHNYCNGWDCRLGRVDKLARFASF